MEQEFDVIIFEIWAKLQILQTKTEIIQIQIILK